MIEEATRIDCDLLVVGGGINGAGIARDAAGRGLRVVLCEKDDLGQHTSSASSKLIHGGLRYLEHREFGLVRKALAERELLLKSAPHIIHPLRFVMPLRVRGGEAGAAAAGQRPAWLIRAGLFLYDHLARRDFLPASGSIDLRRDPSGAALQDGFGRAFSYSDAWVDDARLVVLTAVDAHERGATVLTRTRCLQLQRDAASWSALLAGPAGRLRVRARCLVNATGPWAARFLQGCALPAAASRPLHPLRLVKGSHIVVPRLFEHEHAYLLQQPDGRIVFALPYEGAFTLIGTTDVEYSGDLDRVTIGAAETAYLCEAANRCFARRIGPEDVVWHYAGVRPLLGDDGGADGKAGASASAVSRDYRFETDTLGAPLLSVIGGKLTTFRKLAEEALDWIGPVLGRRVPAWTGTACLPGGDVFGKLPDARAVLAFGDWLASRRQQYPWLAPQLLTRYAHAYGTRMNSLLAGCRTPADLGAEVVPGLFEVELAYLRRHEWACRAEDVLWRRSKLGLHMTPGSADRVDAWLREREAGHMPI